MIQFKHAINDFWLETILFYKFGTIYRQWLIHGNTDICDTLSGRSLISVTKQMFKNYWEKYITKEKCPYSGVLKVALNADNSSSKVLFKKLPRLPQGDYKSLYRFHTKMNETILFYEIRVTIKSKSGVNKVTMLEMG